MEGWLGTRDQPGSASFVWRLLGQDGPLYLVEGITDYLHGPTYSNLWVILLAPDGRAAEFTEWWMEQNTGE